jgi:hypothetical protein
VVATIVLCLGLIVATNIVLILAVLWAGSQVKMSLDLTRANAADADRMRKGLTRAAEAQGMVLRRLCLNTIKEERDRAECLAVAPPITEQEKH